ncbi:hypothetical protein GCM10010360_54280 [Streptomyces nogalater]
MPTAPHASLGDGDYERHHAQTADAEHAADTEEVPHQPRHHGSRAAVIAARRSYGRRGDPVQQRRKHAAVTAGDFPVSLRTTKRQCFGSAGCTMTVEPHLT